MDKLKKLGLSIGTAATLAGPTANAQSNQTETLLGADLKVSTRMGPVTLYGGFGPYARPTATTYNSINAEESQEWAMPTLSTSLKFGVEVGKKNKIVAGIDLGGLADEEKPYNKTKMSIGYKREIVLSKKANLSASIGFFDEFRGLQIPEQGSMVHERRGLEFGLGYEHALTDNLYLFGNAGFSANIDNFGSRNRIGCHAVTGPNNAFSVNVGLHYKFRPEIPEVGMDDLFPTRKSSNKQSKRTRRSMLVYCPAYKPSWSNRNVIFNRP